MASEYPSDLISDPEEESSGGSGTTSGSSSNSSSSGIPAGIIYDPEESSSSSSSDDDDSSDDSNDTNVDLSMLGGSTFLQRAKNIRKVVKKLKARIDKLKKLKDSADEGDSSEFDNWKHWVGTYAEYLELTKDSHTIYFITDNGSSGSSGSEDPPSDDDWEQVGDYEFYNEGGKRTKVRPWTSTFVKAGDAAEDTLLTHSLATAKHPNFMPNSEVVNLYVSGLNYAVLIQTTANGSKNYDEFKAKCASYEERYSLGSVIASGAKYYGSSSSQSLYDQAHNQGYYKIYHTSEATKNAYINTIGEEVYNYCVAPGL